MNLALPAPQVEEAIAPKVEYVEPATAEMARPSRSMMHIEPPPIVEPATTESNETALSQPPPPQSTIPLPPWSVEGLRMAPGINHFEGDAAILPRAPNKNIIQLLLPCLYDDRNFVTYGEAKKYCLIKDTVCYVYNDRTDPMPLYQISFLQNDHRNSSSRSSENQWYLDVMMEDRCHPHRFSTTISPQPDTNLPREEMKTVLLIQSLRSNNSSKTNPVQQQLLYQFTFDTWNDTTIADRFLAVVQSITGPSVVVVNQ